MESIVVGAQGLVGSAFCRALARRGWPYHSVTRAQMLEVTGATCDLLVLACGNAHKGRANAEPEWDFSASVASIAQYVHRVRSQVTVLISTVDVYPDPGAREKTCEDACIDLHDLPPYGFHKRLAELCVLRFASAPLILRVPALVGPGLQKNPIFDHFEPGRRLFVSGASRLNVLHTDDLAEHALALIQKDVRGVVNLAATDSVAVHELAKISGRPCEYHPGAEHVVQHYEIDVERASVLVPLVSSRTAVLRYAGERERSSGVHSPMRGTLR